ncbi:GspH/FimT family pseudopilin [Pseudoalteromonas xiamenensis]
MMHFSKQGGFTLLETIVSMAILVILTCIGLPNIHDLLLKYRMQNDMLSYKHYVHLTRHHAITHTALVTFCPLVEKRCKLTDWGQSPTIFVDINGNSELDQDEKVIHIGESLREYVEFEYPRKAITFRPDGTPKGLHNGTFTYCIKLLNGEKVGQSLSLNHSGRTKLRDELKCEE